MLEISTLGGLSICREGQPVTGFASRKVEALLVYLACTGRTKSREVLAEMLWEERTQSRALANLRVALSSLRKQLGEYLVVTRDTIALNPSAEVWLDTAELEMPLAAYRQDRVTQTGMAVSELETAVGLYRGDFLEGFYLRDSYSFENWTVLERERIRAVYEQSMQLLLDALIAGERWHDVVEWGERWIAQGQTPEPAYRALMFAYCGLGDLANVASVYQRCAQALQLELGVEPSDQTQEAYQKLSTGGWQATSAAAKPTELEAPTADAAAKLLFRQWHERSDDVLDIASLAVVYASRTDLGIGPEESGLLIRSALHHGVDVQPWLRRAGTVDDAVYALDEALERYPRPRVRMEIVQALKGLPSENAAELLVQIAATDDAADVRTEAALAAADRGRLEDVADAQVDALQTGDQPAAVAALVALADQHGLPDGVGPYPKATVAVGLARRRWAASRDAIRRQMWRAATGGALAMAVVAVSELPAAQVLDPESVSEVTATVNVPIWIAVLAITGLIWGGLQGASTGLSIGLHDALWRDDPSAVRRFGVAALAGLVYALLLILVTIGRGLNISVSVAIYMPAFLAYGLLVGAILSLVVPRLGTARSVRSQLARAALAAILMALVAVLLVWIVYGQISHPALIAYLISALLLPLGIALALV